jgi:hypothetical protein
VDRPGCHTLAERHLAAAQGYPAIGLPETGPGGRVKLLMLVFQVETAVSPIIWTVCDAVPDDMVAYIGIPTPPEGLVKPA